jgi:hypothetical protein
MAECAVLYLDRWGNKPWASRTFLSSISRFTSGADYDFYYVLKGYPERQSSPSLAQYREAHPNTEVLWLPDDRYAIGTMAQAAKTLHQEKIIYFLSWCRIQAPRWLEFYLSAFDTVENCGVAGATGSYERHNFRDLNLPFPNVAIRTTSFMINRKTFIELAEERLEPGKGEGPFESGPDGMTRALMSRNLHPVVVDNKGKVWRAEEWPYSHTFRSGYQENLLVADNRTFAYSAGSNRIRKFLADIAWGPGVADVPPLPLYKRAAKRIQWYHGHLFS